MTVLTNISYGHLPNSFLKIVKQPGLPHHIIRAVCSNSNDWFSYQRAWCPLLVSQKLARFLVWRCWGANSAGGRRCWGEMQDVLRRHSSSYPVPPSLAHSVPVWNQISAFQWDRPLTIDWRGSKLACDMCTYQVGQEFAGQWTGPHGP